MIRNILSEAVPSTPPCTINITGVNSDASGFFFDQDELDRILGREYTDNEPFNIYLVREPEGDGRSIQVERNNLEAPSGGSGELSPGHPGSEAGNWQIGDVFAIIGVPLTCQPSDDLECAQFKCQSVDGPMDVTMSLAGPASITGFQCNFDISEVDRILDNTEWSDREFPIYNQRTMEIRYAELFRYPNGGTAPTENRGYLELSTGDGAMADDWEDDDELAFIGISTVCDPDCVNDYPLLDVFLDECSEQYAMDRKNVTDELAELSSFTRKSRLGLFALFVKTKILSQLLSTCDCERSNSFIAGSDRSDSSDDSSSSISSGRSSARSRSSTSTLENLNIIDAFLDIIANDMPLRDMGEMGQLFNIIQQEIQSNE